jgi:hypothetical protein
LLGGFTGMVSSFSCTVQYHFLLSVGQ